MQFRAVILAAAVLLVPTHQAAAQQPSGTPAKASASLVGTWTGTATIPLADSSVVVPVSYTFASGPTGLTGTAVVPGQGFGPIGFVVVDGKKVKFRVAMAKGILEHEGEFTANGGMEGIVNMDKLPVAKFKITLKK